MVTALLYPYGLADLAEAVDGLSDEAHLGRKSSQALPQGNILHWVHTCLQAHHAPKHLKVLYW